MTDQITYVKNGWTELNGAIIFCPSQARLPITPEDLFRGADLRWPGGVVHCQPDDRVVASVRILGEEPAAFTVRLYEGNQLIGVDGTPRQNVVVAAWLRSLMPEDAPRMVVGDKGFGVHAELPYGVTPEQIASSMIRHVGTAWNANDPDLQW